LHVKNTKLKQLYTTFSGAGGNSFLKYVSLIESSQTDFARRTNSSDIFIQENTNSTNPLKLSLLETAKQRKHSETLPTKRRPTFLN